MLSGLTICVCTGRHGVWHTFSSEHIDANVAGISPESQVATRAAEKLCRRVYQIHRDNRCLKCSNLNMLCQSRDRESLVNPQCSHLCNVQWVGARSGRVHTRVAAAAAEKQQNKRFKRNALRLLKTRVNQRPECVTIRSLCILRAKSICVPIISSNERAALTRAKHRMASLDSNHSRKRDSNGLFMMIHVSTCDKTTCTSEQTKDESKGHSVPYRPAHLQT